MPSKKWYFESKHPWQLFGDSFRRELGDWKPKSLAVRLLGFRVSFESADDTGGPFQALDKSLRVKLDVIVQVRRIDGLPVPSWVRLTLTDLGGSTGGHIEFSHSVGAAGGDLGDYAIRSIQAVDPEVKLKSA